MVIVPVADCAPIAAALDRVGGGGACGNALSAEGAALDEPAITPSARVLREMERTYRNSFLDFALAQSLRYRQSLLEPPLAPDSAARYEEMAAESPAARRRIEDADRIPFATRRQRYLSQDRLTGEYFRSEG